MATEHLDWFKPWDAVEEYDFDSDEPFVRYFRGGELNASCNCIDRHLNGPRRNKAALIWQGEPTEEVDVYTYQRLHREVCKAANMLRRLGVRKGDRVVLYMPMVPQLAISMLACARIGAIHCVVFSGLSAESLKDRIVDSGATVVITSNYGYRSGKILRLKEICDKALDMCPQVESCVVVRRIEKRTAMKAGRDFWWDDVLAPEAPQCEPERMEANDPLFILYTSAARRNRRASCMAPAAICFTPPSPRSTCSTSRNMTFSGARPTPAGSPVIPTSCTGRCRTGRRRSCSKACPTSPSPTVSGRR